MSTTSSQGNITHIISPFLIQSNLIDRRIDLLSEDLALDNKYEESQKKKKALKTTQKKTTKPKRKKRNIDTSYHYIAYVPYEDRVWELDGLQTRPRAVGIIIPLSPFTRYSI